LAATQVVNGTHSSPTGIRYADTSTRYAGTLSFAVVIAFAAACVAGARQASISIAEGIGTTEAAATPLTDLAGRSVGSRTGIGGVTGIGKRATQLTALAGAVHDHAAAVVAPAERTIAGIGRTLAGPGDGRAGTDTLIFRPVVSGTAVTGQEGTVAHREGLARLSTTGVTDIAERAKGGTGIFRHASITPAIAIFARATATCDRERTTVGYGARFGTAGRARVGIGATRSNFRPRDELIAAIDAIAAARTGASE
jgi:hypothetical protein